MRRHKVYTLGVHLNSSYLRTLRSCVLEWTNQELYSKSMQKNASTSCRVESKYSMQIFHEVFGPIKIEYILLIDTTQI